MTSQTESIWRHYRHAFPLLRSYPPEENVTEDVVVIGAGIAGLSIALALIEDGRKVVVIEKASIGAGQTLRTSAHLASALDDRFFLLERWHGPDGAQRAARSHAQAIDRIERWSKQYSIMCNFLRVDGFLLEQGATDPNEFEREHDAALRSGLDVQTVQDVPNLELGRALRYTGQARFNPVAYIAGLARTIEDLGGVFVREEVVEVKGGATPKIRTAEQVEISARAVVIATNVPFHEAIPIHTKQAPYRSYVIGCPIPRDDFPDILLWDMADPYHYVRRVDDEDSLASWLIIGGGDHKTGQSPDALPYSELFEWARSRFSNVGPPEWSWSGQIIEPIDGLAFIGRDPGGQDNVFVATGDSGNGLTHATIAADIIPDLIQGRPDPWGGLYDPRRKPVQALGTWLGENANVAAQYRDWFSRGEARSLDLLDGTVIRQGVHRIAVSRGMEGALHAFSAVCPHLGCCVRWNDAERTWDCPCHGSRFDPVDGHVLNGPAANGLDPIDQPE
jgi:glycine/D-amino acid oxidase-like deaminating enzyme/nitrite reductase/ring-hydroxylating ferredoxin subunit